MILPVAVPSDTVAPTASRNSTVKLSSSSEMASSSRATEMVSAVSPGSKRSLPEVSV